MRHGFLMRPVEKTSANESRRLGQASVVLQRKCACSGPRQLHGECEACRTKRLDLKNRSADQVESPGMPPIVQEVLGSAGQPMDAQTRAFFEPRFGHDFGKVRIHSDGRAAESARAVNALAYTVGSDISFGTSSYRPHTVEGRRLIAHELAHVVQQSQNTVGSPPSEARLEADADRAASAVTSGLPPVLNGFAQGGLQRQQAGGGTRTPTPPPPVAPNARQQGIIDTARQAAAIRCQVAMFRVRGIAPAGPSGAIDPSIELGMRARSLAQTMFQWADPNMDQIGDVIGSMVNFLTSGVQVMVAGAGDPECGSRAAYVRGLRPPIVLCPGFFSDSSEQRIRTMIHESAHLSRIGSGALGESYCVDFDCATSCGGFDSADSWAHFVHCLSSQKPDKPVTIKGRAPPGNPGQTPQRGSGGGG
jgi:hypothetical protein